jgi:hypothetical protein
VIARNPLQYRLFYPTNALVGGRNLIRVAVARDAFQAAPLSGSYNGEPEDFESMSIELQVAADRRFSLQVTTEAIAQISQSGQQESSIRPENQHSTNRCLGDKLLDEWRP